MIKNKKGITLIALVITIIVLLVLAGVSLNMLLGENGILTKVQTAKSSQERAGLKEEAQLTMLSIETEKLISDDSKSFKEVLESGISGATIEAVNATESSSGLTDVYYVLKGGDYVTVYEDGEVIDGKIEIWDGKKVSCPEFKKENNIWNWYIYNPSQFKFLADFVNNGDGTNTPESLASIITDAGYTASEIKMTPDVTIYIINDLDLGARQENGELIAGAAWTPIGLTSANVANKLGTVEGNNKVIKGIYIKTDNNYNGIFGISNTIKNLTIKDSYINGGIWTGGISGVTLSGYINNCHNVNTITIGNGNIGGIIGYSGVDLENCTNSGFISGQNQVGGIVGNITSENKIKKCRNEGTVHGESYNTGGIIGYTHQFNNIEQCINNGIITGNNYIGGIAGVLNSESTINKCYNNSSITGQNSCIGGISGFVAQKTVINECDNNGLITGQNSIVGGIVGYIDSESIISKCNNNSSVTGLSGYVGGISGSVKQNVTISECKNNSSITGQDKYIGGIAGDVNLNTTISKCNNSGEIFGKNDRVGGIVGDATYVSDVTGCSNTGTVTGSGKYIGGIIGIFSTDNQDPSDKNPPILRNCMNSGKVKGIERTGGIIGAAAQYSSLIERCYNLGEVEGTGIYIGGIVGTLGRSSKVNNCYNAKSVTGTEYVGGLVGYTYYSKCEIKNCYNIGIVKGNNHLGGIMGDNLNSTVPINSYYLEGTANLDIGTRNVSNLKKDKTFLITTFIETANAGETVWKVDANENNGYPILVEPNE